MFTNGVFDILHRGHVTYLARARALGAALVVAVNSDASVRMLGKGDDRPLNREDDRAAILAALQCVDLVTIFGEREPLTALRAVRPEIYVKGGDYDIDSDSGKRGRPLLGRRLHRDPVRTRTFDDFAADPHQVPRLKPDAQG